MSDLRRPDRSQVQLLPAWVDDYVAPAVPARVLDAAVEGLDFAAWASPQPAPGAEPADRA